MTHTDPSGPVPVTREDRLATQAMLEHAFRNVEPDALLSVNLFEVAQHLARHRLSSGSDVLAEAVKPWANYHGDLPDYGSPLRSVYESGIQYAVELLAKVLGVTEYTPCDGTEEFDGDLGGTLMNIVLAAMPTDQDGDPIHPSDLLSALAASGSDVVTVPSGEALFRAALVRIANGDFSETGAIKFATSTLATAPTPTGEEA